MVPGVGKKTYWFKKGRIPPGSKFRGRLEKVGLLGQRIEEFKKGGHGR